ncbi:MAG: glycosyltransferase [Anaerolineae bacterium]
MDGKKILLLTPQLPYPPHQGTTIRNYNLVADLAEHHEIHLLSFADFRGELEENHPLRRYCKSVELVPAPERTMFQRFMATFFSTLPDMALRLSSPEFYARLAAVLMREKFDIIQIEGIEMARYGLWLRSPEGRKLLGRRTLLVFDDHNAEYVLQQRAFETDARRPRRWAGALYSLVQWRKLRRYEREICRQADRVVAVSEADRVALLRLVPDIEVAVIPNGVDLEYYHPGFLSPISVSNSLVFTGKMDFRPNVDAMLWFCEEVLPRVRAEVPDVHFYIVGQKPHSHLRHLLSDPAVTITGYVDDVRPYIARASIYVVPLRIGGGTRLKVLEAMAMGKAIVSTRLGCEGFEITDGREALLADSPEDFARRVVELLADPARREELGWAAHRFAEERYDWRAIVPRFEQVYGS